MIEVVLLLSITQKQKLFHWKAAEQLCLMSTIQQQAITVKEAERSQDFNVKQTEHQVIFTVSFTRRSGNMVTIRKRQSKKHKWLTVTGFKQTPRLTKLMCKRKQRQPFKLLPTLLCKHPSDRFILNDCWLVTSCLIF